MTSPTSKTSILVAIGCCVLVAGTLVALFGLMESHLRAPLYAEVIRTSTPTPTPTVTLNSSPPTAESPIPLVGGDLVANPPDFPILMSPPATTIAATFLGSPGDGPLSDVAAYAFATDADTVCLTVGDRDAGMTTVCTPLDEFRSVGVTYDGGSWAVTFTSDGVVNWAGV